ncbi:hypothetical protein DM860_015189 [Cuscuta australis]|uniref:Peroxisomal membrane protein PEX14 n=1 Tax=Cuscuta australis TaxID=267555 RepID=A0A328D2M7_9ASTE|nr:hypothetical protein DM860_015189 [Cuscuta australis]
MPYPLGHGRLRVFFPSPSNALHEPRKIPTARRYSTQREGVTLPIDDGDSDGLGFRLILSPYSPLTQSKTNFNPQLQSLAEGIRSSNLEAAKEKHSPFVFVNSEPIREDQVQNVVKFLADPKAKGSPVMYRRSFLERKGLTKENIDDSFRRVPVST